MDKKIEKNEKFRLVYKSLGKEYQDFIKAELIGQGIRPVTFKNWVNGRTQIPAFAAPKVAEAVNAAFAKLVSDLNITNKKLTIRL